MSQRMTIADAEQVFQMGGPSYAADFASAADIFEHTLVEQHDFGMRHLSHISSPLKSTNHIGTLGWSNAMINQTRHSFNMLTSSDRLVTSLYTSFRDMLERMARRGGETRIVVVDGESGVLEQLSKEFEHILQVIRATAKEPIEHFFTSDGHRVRQERPHEPLQADSDANQVTSNFYFNNKAMTNMMDIRFEAIWKRLIE